MRANRLGWLRAGSAKKDTGWACQQPRITSFSALEADKQAAVAREDFGGALAAKQAIAAILALHGVRGAAAR